ncbi:MAG TPA: hydrogenase maturation protease [Candidatus Binatia bacterium]|nr:hydrogenase maturation protease [Candidatus Binatia bacterium]
MNKKILIGGIGNVLLGDDAFGPYVIRLLESQYVFPDNVEIADLGTPALDLTHRIAGLHAVIFIDCVASREHPPGTVLLYRKADIVRAMPAKRLDPHSPALSECLMTAEMLGASPQSVLLVGIVGQAFDAGRNLSHVVERSSAEAVAAILAELQKLGIQYERRQFPPAPSIWWSDSDTVTREREGPATIVY